MAGGASTGVLTSKSSFEKSWPPDDHWSSSPGASSTATTWPCFEGSSFDEWC